MTTENQSLFTMDEYKSNFKQNKKGKKEEAIQLQVCEFLRNVHPDLIWFCDLASGMRLPIWVATMNAKMRSSRGLPDLVILKPKHKNVPGGAYLYYGLFVEIKKDGIRLKNGNMPSSDHIREQEAILLKLRGLGYCAEMVSGYDEAVNLITEYLK